MLDRKLKLATNILDNLGIEGILTESKVKGKRFTITKPDGKKINFGAWPYTGDGTFLDHGDDKIKKAWKTRMKVIKNSSGKLAYKDKNSPLFYSWNILW